MKKGKLSIVRIRCLKKTLKDFTETWVRPENLPLWQKQRLTGSHYGEKEAQSNERAEWIRREQKRKVSHKDWMPIQITEITSYLSKAHNWKFLEVIKYKITGLRLSQLLTIISQKTSMQ